MDKALIGLCPIGKFAFSHERAMQHKADIQKKLTGLGIRYCDLEGVIADGMVRAQEDAALAVRYFKERGVDGLFIPHCNFGTEGAAGAIAKELGVPVLLYGPRDDAPLPGGERLTDTLCGLFATSKVLGKLKVPFSYIENCRVDETAFAQGVDRFARAARAVRVLRSMRIGQIGGRIDFFWCTIIDEADLLRKFNLQVQPIDLVYFIRDVKKRAADNYEAYSRELAGYKETLINTDGLPDTGFINGLAARDELRHLARKLDLDGFAVQGFPSLCEALGDGGELGMSLVQEDIPLGAETDVLGVASSVVLRAASKNGGPCFMPEWVMRHPENDNAVLLWHGNCPPSLKHPEAGKMEIYASWIMPTSQRTNIAYRIREGELTICRLDGEDGRYRLGIGRAKTVDGPRTLEFYTWAQVSDWPRYERRLIEGPYPHHCSCVFDDCADVLEEACRFVPDLTADVFDRR